MQAKTMRCYFYYQIGFFKKINNSLYSRCHGKTSVNINLHNVLGEQRSNIYQYFKFTFAFDPEYLLESLLKKYLQEDTQMCTRIFTAGFLITKLLETLNYQKCH